MISALADEHVLSALVHALRRRGMDVATVQDRGLRKTEDPELLSLSMQEQRLLLTNDTDFLALANDLAKRAEPFAPILFWPQQRRTIRHLLSRIIPLASQADYARICSRVYYL